MTIELPPITDDDRQFLHDNPNTSDIVEWVRSYALDSIHADRLALSNELSDALQSDLEHGVKMLNEKAAEDFKRAYPALNKVLAAL